MLKIPIDLWLKYGEKMEAVGNKLLEFARDGGGSIDEIEVVLKMWNMILADMRVVQAGRNLGGTFEVI